MDTDQARIARPHSIGDAVSIIVASMNAILADTFLLAGATRALLRLQC